MVLFNELNHESIFESLGEPKEVEEKRKQIMGRINTLNKSYKALKKDPTVSKLMDDDWYVRLAVMNLNIQMIMR